MDSTFTVYRYKGAPHFHRKPEKKTSDGSRSLRMRLDSTHPNKKDTVPTVLNPWYLAKIFMLAHKKKNPPVKDPATKNNTPLNDTSLNLKTPPKLVPAEGANRVFRGSVLKGGLVDVINKKEGIHPLGKPEKAPVHDEMSSLDIMTNFEYIYEKGDFTEKLNPAALRWFNYFAENSHLISFSDNSRLLRNAALGVLNTYEGKELNESQSKAVSKDPAEVEGKATKHTKSLLEKISTKPDNPKLGYFFTESELRWLKKLPEARHELSTNPSALEVYKAYYYALPSESSTESGSEKEKGPYENPDKSGDFPSLGQIYLANIYFKNAQARKKILSEIIDLDKHYTENKQLSESQLTRFIGILDKLINSKTDLITERGLKRLERFLAKLNPETGDEGEDINKGLIRMLRSSKLPSEVNLYSSRENLIVGLLLSTAKNNLKETVEFLKTGTVGFNFPGPRERIIDFLREQSITDKSIEVFLPKISKAAPEVSTALPVTQQTKPVDQMAVTQCFSIT